MLIHFALVPAILFSQALCVLASPNSSIHLRRAKLLLQRQASTNIATLPPSQDPFYKVPANIATYARGSIIRSRKVPETSSIYGPDSGDVYQLLFRTNSIHMQPDAAVTTVIAPKVPAKGSAKIVAVSDPEDSPGIDCALSWSLVPSKSIFSRYTYKKVS